MLAPSWWILIVEDEADVVQSLLRTTPKRWRPVVAGSVAAAREMLEHRGVPMGAIVDLGLPDGTGLDLVDDIRRLDRELPIMVLTGQLTGDVINATNRMGASYVCKPANAENFQVFWQEVEAHEGHRLATARTMGQQWGLTPRELETVVLAASGVPRGRLSDVMGVSENTVKRHVNGVLTKAGMRTLSEVVWLLRKTVEENETAKID